MIKNNNTTKIERMQKRYIEWLNFAWSKRDEMDITQAMIDKMKEISSDNGYSFLMKDNLLLIFKSPENDLLFAWHYDADVSYQHFETGFDPSPGLEDLYEQDLLSEGAYRRCILETLNISALPEKLEGAVRKYLEDPDSIDKTQYQNIYHNLYKKDTEYLQALADKYTVEVQLSKVFKKISFLKS